MHSIKMSQICIISKQLPFFKFLLTTLVCLIILTRNYNIPRTISVKVLTLPVATEPTLLMLMACNGVKNCMCQHKCDFLEERFCFASTWFWYRLFIASKLMSSQKTIFCILGQNLLNFKLKQRKAQNSILCRRVGI